MSDGYYPEYYLRKRRKDRVYGLVTRIVIVLIIAGSLGGVAGFFAWQYVLKPRKAGSGITQEMASQRQDLATQEKLAVAARHPLEQHAKSSTVDFQPTQLSALNYADSMPLTSVGLISGAGAAESTAQVPALEKDPPRDEAAPLGPVESKSESAMSGEDFESTPPASAADKPTAPKEPLRQDNPPASKSEEKKPAKEKESPASKPAAAQPEAASPVFKVYAGSSSSRDEADRMRSELSSLGLSSSVIKSGADFLVLVATVNEYSQAQALTSDLQGKGFGAFSTRSKGK